MKSDKCSRYKWLYETYENDLYSYGMAFGIGKEELEDCVQDVFLYLYEHDCRLWESDNIKAYLLKCLKNRILIEKRRNILLEEFTEDKVEDEFTIEVNGFELIMDEKEQMEKIQRLQEMLNALTPRQREAIYLRYTQGLSYEEVGRVMGIQPTAAQKLVYRAIEEMRNRHPQMLCWLLLCLMQPT